MSVLNVPVIKVETWKDFFTLASVMISDYGKWIYRGHQDANWKLLSALDRYKRDNGSKLKNQKWTERSKRRKLNYAQASFQQQLQDYLSMDVTCDEFKAIKDFKDHVGQEFDFGEDWVSYLSVMQHYGVKTRLLDFTKSLFVALFFAFENASVKSSRAIYALNLEGLKRRVSEILEKVQRVTNKFDIWEYSRYKANEILASNNSENKGSGVLPIRRFGMNPRAELQQGLFLMSFGRADFEKSLCNIFQASDLAYRNQIQIEDWMSAKGMYMGDCMLKIVFAPEMNVQSTLVLQQLNLTHRTIYQGWDAVARSISYSLVPDDAKIDR